MGTRCGEEGTSLADCRCRLGFPFRAASMRLPDAAWVRRPRADQVIWINIRVRGAFDIVGSLEVFCSKRYLLDRPNASAAYCSTLSLHWKYHC